MPNQNYDLDIYTDGANRNTGNYKGGFVKPDDLSAWAYVIYDRPEHILKQAGQGLYGVTNNEMELTAFANVLEYLYANNLQHQHIIFNSDSTYVHNTIVKNRLDHWATNNWHNSSGKVPHRIQWELVYELLPQFSNYEFNWVKGHADCKGNNYADKLVNRKMDELKGADSHE